MAPWTESAAPLESWEFGWNVSGDDLAFADEDRRQWKSRLPLYLLADHLTAEPAFLSMLQRIRASDDRTRATHLEAGCFSPRAGAKGARRAVMTRLLESAAAATPGEEKRALEALVPRAWAGEVVETVRLTVRQDENAGGLVIVDESVEVHARPPGRRIANASQDRYIARVWTGVRVLVCRAAGCCVQCHLSSIDPKPRVENGRPPRLRVDDARASSRGDYCREHAQPIDAVRHRKAVEHLFLDLAAVLPPAR
jgi:hypothetical protein